MKAGENKTAPSSFSGFHHLSWLPNKLSVLYFVKFLQTFRLVEIKFLNIAASLHSRWAHLKAVAQFGY